MNRDLCNKENEMAIIGCLLGPYAKDHKHQLSLIHPDDFSDSETKEIFENILKFSAEQKEPPDIVTIKSYINKNLFKCAIDSVASVYTDIHFNSYLSQLKFLSFQRRIKKTLIAMATGEDTIRLSDLKLLIESENDNHYMATYKDKASKALNDFLEGVGTEKPRIKLGFPSIDRTTGGLRIPSVMMIGAYPSVGKTAFALNVALCQKEPVLIFSLEMSTETILERMVSAMEKIDYSMFSDQKFSSAEIKKIKSCTKSIKDKGVYIFDDIYDIESQGMAISSIKPRLVIVDYIQKVKTAEKTENRRSEIDYISGMYKQIANYNNCVIILLSQISRVDRNEPKMSSLKESGALEADGDYVAILHRPYVIEKDNPEVTPEESYILIDKNKFGNTGKLSLTFNGRYQQFYEEDFCGEGDVPLEFLKG